MIDEIIFSHLSGNENLASLLTRYKDRPAIFNQKIPSDADPCWAKGTQYGRVVYALNVQGDAARVMGGSLIIDVQCDPFGAYPEQMEPVVRNLIDGYFFSGDGCAMAAQWLDSRYFTEADEKVSGVTLSFDLLAFPLVTTPRIDVTGRANDWTAKQFPNLLVINYNTLPDVWKPTAEKSAAYWRVASVKPAGWIPDTYQTVWRTAELRGHIFADKMNKAAEIAQEIALRMYADKRLLKTGESPIIVNQNNVIDMSADTLRTGQILVEATYGEIVTRKPYNPLNHINYI